MSTTISTQNPGIPWLRPQPQPLPPDPTAPPQSWAIGDVPDSSWTNADLQRMSIAARQLQKYLDRAPAEAPDNVLYEFKLVPNQAGNGTFDASGFHRMTSSAYGAAFVDTKFTALYDPVKGIFTKVQEKEWGGAPGVGFHHPNPRHAATVSLYRDVAATPDKVWAAIGKFDALPWHPGLEAGTVTTQNGVTTRRLVSSDGGPVFTEQLVSTNPHEIRYKMVDGLPVHPEGTLRVEPHGQSGSRIVWEAEFDASTVDAETAAAVTKGITNFYQAGLDSLQKNFFGPA